MSGPCWTGRGVDAEDIPRYDEAVEAVAYFCILEALQNVVKHSAASEVRVQPAAADDRLEVDSAPGAGPTVHGTFG